MLGGKECGVKEVSDKVKNDGSVLVTASRQNQTADRSTSTYPIDVDLPEGLQVPTRCQFLSPRN